MSNLTKCKHNKVFYFLQKICYEDFCINNTILIQKMYKGYYIRKKIKIYYTLPRSLKRNIIWHINSDLYLKNSCLGNVLWAFLILQLTKKNL